MEFTQKGGQSQVRASRLLEHFLVFLDRAQEPFCKNLVDENKVHIPVKVPICSSNGPRLI